MFVISDLSSPYVCHIFFPQPPGAPPVKSLDNSVIPPFQSLVNKVNGCINHLEQFPVKVHDLPGAGSSTSRGSQALKFFNTHQLKVSRARGRVRPSLKLKVEFTSSRKYVLLYILDIFCIIFENLASNSVKFASYFRLKFEVNVAYVIIKIQ